MNILEIKNLSIFYKEKNILEDINLDIKQNEIICIMGSSGSGKSTLLSCLNGFLIENGGSYTGDIFFRGENIKNIKPIELKRKISTLFQDSKPFDFSIEKFLNLSEELQDNITKKAERLYNGQPEILNQLKRKSSKNFYLKFIWVEILKTIDKEYPEIDIVGMKGEVR